MVSVSFNEISSSFLCVWGCCERKRCWFDCAVSKNTASFIQELGRGKLLLSRGGPVGKLEDLDGDGCWYKERRTEWGFSVHREGPGHGSEGYYKASSRG